MEKLCSKCSKVQPTTEFYKGSKSAGYKDGLNPWCKTCKREYDRVLYAATKHLWVERHRQRKYGLSPSAFEDLFVDQNGRCAVCPNVLGPGWDTHIDHCHATGQVRALLCRGCNVALGQLNEDPVRIRALADYAERHAD